MQKDFPKIRCEGLSQLGMLTKPFDNAMYIIKIITSEPGRSGFIK
jgi:hypothetical protein